MVVSSRGRASELTISHRSVTVESCLKSEEVLGDGWSPQRGTGRKRTQNRTRQTSEGREAKRKRKAGDDEDVARSKGTRSIDSTRLDSTRSDIDIDTDVDVVEEEEEEVEMSDGRTKRWLPSRGARGDDARLEPLRLLLLLLFNKLLSTLTCLLMLGSESESEPESEPEPQPGQVYSRQTKGRITEPSEQRSIDLILSLSVS